jgi:hypothetical protein
MATTMEQQFAEAQERALKQVEQEIFALYQDGQEEVSFRFDAFSFWDGRCSGAREVFRFLHDHQLGTDNWYRGVFSLSKEQAVELAKLVGLWNADWEYQIARHYDVDQSEYYNAYAISFSPASGREHQISVSTGGRYTTDSWQWS